MAYSSLNATLGGSGQHSPDRLRRKVRQANKRKRRRDRRQARPPVPRPSRGADPRPGSQGRARIRRLNREIERTQRQIVRRSALAPRLYEPFAVTRSTDTSDLEERLSRLRARRTRLASRVAERGQKRQLARHDTLLESVEKAAWFAPGLGVTGGLGRLAVKGGATLLGKQGAKQTVRAAAPKAPRPSPRPASGSARAARPSQPRYGRSAGKRGPATAKPKSGSKPRSDTPNRAMKGRQRRRIEQGYSRKPIRSRGRRTAQVGGATASGAAALDVAALSRGEDPEAFETLGNIARGPYHVARAFAEDKAVREETLRAVKAIPREFVPGVVGAFTRPKATAEGMAEQYKRTYEPLLEGDTEEFERRLAEPGSGGALGPALDYALIGGPAASAAAGAAARRGVLGSDIRRITTSDRPDLRYAPGASGAKRQDASGRLVKRVVQHRRDEARRRKQARRHEAREEGGARATDALDPGKLAAAGEVVPRHARTEERLTRKQAAREKGRGRVVLQEERARLMKDYRKLEKSLSAEQRRALVPVLRGEISPDDPDLAVAQIRARIRDIELERGRRRARGNPVRVAGGPGRAENVADLRRLLADIESRGAEIYTPGFRAAAEAMGEIERRYAGKREELGELGADGPGASQAELRRLKPSVETAIRQGELPRIEQVLGGDVRALEERVRDLTAQARTNPEARREADAAIAEVNAARAVEPVLELQRAYDEVSAAMRTAPANAAARAELASTRKSIKDALERARAELFEDSTFGTYINRVLASGALGAAQKARGTIDPAYVPSERRLRELFSLAAIGGSRGLRAERRYEGELFRTGREDLSPRVFLQGLEKSVKRAENLGLIARIADQMNVPLTRLVAEQAIRKGLERVPDKDRTQIDLMEPMAAVNELVRRKALREDEIPASLRRLEADAKDARGRIVGPMRDGRTAKEVLDDLDLLGISEKDVVLWNPERLFKAVARPSDADPAGFELEDTAGIGQAFQEFSIRDDIRARAGTRTDSGWHAIPRAAFEELQVLPGQFEKAARVLDITKSAYSRLLLGYGNISWLQFQVGSNAFLTALAGVGPFEVIRAQLWWHGLSDQHKAALRPVLNIQSNLLDVNKRSLGSKAGPFATRIRALRETQFWQIARKASPAQIADLAFAFDRKQTGFFRRAVLYDQVKKQAIQNMARETKGIVAAQERFLAHIYNTPDLKEQMLGVIRNRRDLERHAEHVDRMLGDYLTFTAKERATAQRFVMFYGFLRHSTQFALWTMPTRHPVTLGIIGKLALLSDKERREMLGIDDLPYGVAGIEFDTTPDGTGVMLNVARMSPVGNAIFEAPSPSSMLGVLPPAVSIPAQHFFGIKMFTGTPYATEGRSVGQMYSEALQSGKTLGQLTDVTSHLRVFANEIESAIPAIRLYREVKFRGRQGDDASLIFGLFGDGARPLAVPKTEPARSSVIAAEARNKARPAGEIIAHNLAGLKELTPEYAAFLRSREERSSGAPSAPAPSGGSSILESLGIGGGSSSSSSSSSGSGLSWSSSSSSSRSSGLIWDD